MYVDGLFKLMAESLLCKTDLCFLCVLKKMGKPGYEAKLLCPRAQDVHIVCTNFSVNAGLV